MDNRVGDKLPSEKEVATILADIASIKTRLAKWGVHLSAEERLGATKLRAGAEELAPKLVSIAQSNKVEIRNVPLAGMTDDLALAKAMQPIELAIDELRQIAADTRLEASSEAAQAFYAYYSRLAKMAEMDPELETQMAPLVAVMATGRRKK